VQDVVKITKEAVGVAVTVLYLTVTIKAKYIAILLPAAATQRKYRLP
jgi:hypothetical protein